MSIDISGHFKGQDYEALEFVTIYLRGTTTLGALVELQSQFDETIFDAQLISFKVHERYGRVVELYASTAWDSYQDFVDAMEDIPGIVAITPSGNFRENKVAEFEDFKPDLTLVSSDKWKPMVK